MKRKPIYTIFFTRTLFKQTAAKSCSAPEVQQTLDVIATWAQSYVKHRK